MDSLYPLLCLDLTCTGLHFVDESYMDVWGTPKGRNYLDVDTRCRLAPRIPVA